MRKILALALTLIISVNAWATPPGSPTLWERAAYGNKSGVTLVTLQGHNTGITSTAEAVWPESAAYTPLLVAMSSPYCASADVDDDGDPTSNTGAWTIRVKGITSAFAAFSEDKTLNGRTSVALTNTTAMLINSVEVLTAGTTGSNEGVIRCGTGTNTNGVPAVVHAHVPVGHNRSAQAWYGVPEGYTLLCKNWAFQSYGVTAAQTIQFRLYKNVNAGLVTLEYLAFLNQAGASSVTLPRIVAFPEKTVLRVDALSAASTGPVSVKADCLLLEDAWVSTAQDLF
jgi:hypothetical protein